MRYLLLTCLLLAVPLALALPGAAQASGDVGLDPQHIDGHVLLVDHVLLPDGGFVVIHDEGFLTGDTLGSVVGVSAHFGPGNHGGVAVPLNGLPVGEHTLVAVPYRDDGDGAFELAAAGDRPYGPSAMARVEVAASFVFVDQRTEDGTVHLHRVALPEGGFIVLHDDGLLDGDATGSVVGSSSYLEPGTHTDVVVTAHDLGMLTAMAHHDTDGDTVYDFATSDGAVDGPYMRDGTAVVAQANVEPVERDEADREPRAGPTTASEDTAGAGVLGLVALLGAACVARRR